MRSKYRYLIFSVILFASILVWAEAPNVLPLGKIGDKDLSAVFPSDKWMFVIILAGQIIWALLSYIWKQKEKKDNKSEAMLTHITEMVHKMQGQIQELGQAPTETEIVMALQPHVKLAVMEALMKYNGKV